MKIYNIAQARSQTGPGKADIVCVLPVGGRLTRLLAIFPPYAQTNGSGDALVLRDGKAFQARGSRPSDGGTTFTTASGQLMAFAAGLVRVVLAAR